MNLFCWLLFLSYFELSLFDLASVGLAGLPLSLSLSAQSVLEGADRDPAPMTNFVFLKKKRKERKILCVFLSPIFRWLVDEQDAGPAERERERETTR